MSRAWELECFDTADAVPVDGAVALDSALEEERLKSFDTGYKAGWDDAAAAHAKDQARISAELADNLQQLSFTYHEARGSVLQEMEDLLKGLVSRVLPETMVPALGEMIVEQVRGIADEAAEIEVEIVVCPENAARVRQLIDGKVAPPTRVLEEPTLGDGQAFIRLGHAERKIDLEAVLDELAGAVTEFFDPTDIPEVSNG